MTLTLEHITPEDEAMLRETLRLIAAMGDRIGGWQIAKSTVNRKSATLYLKWDNDVSPMDNRDLQGIFQVAPAIVSALVSKLADYPLDPAKALPSDGAANDV